jgi:hypothetical protein
MAPHVLRPCISDSLPENMRRHSVEIPTKPKPEIQTIANAQDKEIWPRDPIALAKRISGVESRKWLCTRWRRENVAEGDHHREGLHSLPIEDYMVYIPTFSGGQNWTFFGSVAEPRQPGAG